jgi:hypothetical protein
MASVQELHDLTEWHAGELPRTNSCWGEPNHSESGREDKGVRQCGQWKSCSAGRPVSAPGKALVQFTRTVRDPQGIVVYHINKDYTSPV